MNAETDEHRVSPSTSSAAHRKTREEKKKTMVSAAPERLSLASRHFLGLQCSSIQPFCLGQERLCAVGAFEQDAEVS